jgi:hypothetical protein
MKFRNFTPHDIVLNDGKVFKSEGIARVTTRYSAIKGYLCNQVFGVVEGLPKEKSDVKIIVSAIVLQASNRKDLVAPATGHPETIRDEKGHIVSVPCFVVNQ